MKTIVLKIGGSVCTEKKKGLLKAKEGEIGRIVKEIKKALEKRKFKLIVVHGAGPFGHVMVERYGINEGVWNKRHLEGFVKTCQAMERLNGIIVGKFLKEGLFVMPVQPSAVIVQNNKKLVKFDVGVVKELMKREIIPVMYGDFVVDEKIGGSVVSGDTVAVFLGEKFGADLIAFGTDVDGILDGDGGVIKNINKKNYAKVVEMICGTKSVDVTGGMKGKMEKIGKLCKGNKVVVFNMGEKGNTYKLLIGKDIGTKIAL